MGCLGSIRIVRSNPEEMGRAYVTSTRKGSSKQASLSPVGEASYQHTEIVGKLRCGKNCKSKRLDVFGLKGNAGL
jgi:hypothetical protein